MLFNENITNRILDIPVKSGVVEIAITLDKSSYNCIITPIKGVEYLKNLVNFHFTSDFGIVGQTVKYDRSIEALKIGERYVINKVIKERPFEISFNRRKNYGFSLTISFEENKEIPLVMSEKIKKQFMNNDFSDVKIICGGKTFECHKFVLRLQSGFFRGKLTR